MLSKIKAAFLLFCMQLAIAEERTALRKHADFFDADGDGKLSVTETRNGLQKLGFGYVRAGVLASAINLGLGRQTGARWYEPSKVYLDNIKRGKHDSDTNIYDTEGNFVSSRLDEILNQFDLDGDDAISQSELGNMYDILRESTAGSAASRAEFGLLMEIAGEEGVTEKLLTRETLEQFYNGTLFYIIAGIPVPPLNAIDL